MADATRLDPDAHLSGTRLRNFSFDKLKGAIRFSHLHNTHLRHSSSRYILHHATLSLWQKDYHISPWDVKEGNNKHGKSPPREMSRTNIRCVFDQCIGEKTKEDARY